MPTPPRRDKSARPDSTLRTSTAPAPSRAGRATAAVAPLAAAPRSTGTPTGRRPARSPAARPGEPRRDAGSAGGAGSPGGNETIPRQRLEVDARRAQLVALGIELFSTRPYEEVRIDEVADAAGVSKGLLYHYFPTKRDFYVATLREAAGALLAETADDAPETGSAGGTGGTGGGSTGTQTAPLARLHRGLHKYLSFAERYATAYLALMRGGAGADAAVVQLIESTRTEFMERLIAGVQAGLAADHALSEALTGRSPRRPLPIPAQLQDQPALLRVALRGWIGYVEAASLEWLVTLGHAPSLAPAAAAPARPASRDALVDLLIALLLAALRAAA